MSVSDETTLFSLSIDDGAPYGTRPELHEASFNPDEWQWKEDLTIALYALPRKAIIFNEYHRYYEGDHPRVWLTESMKKMFDAKLTESMSENWCELVVDAPIHRIEVTDWDGPGAVKAQAIWDDNDLGLDQSDVYRNMRITGESFVHAWPDDQSDTGYDVNVIDARWVYWPENCHRADPDVVVWCWPDRIDRVWRATVFYPEVCIRLIGPKIVVGSNDNIFPGVNAFSIDPDEPGGKHGFDKVPIIRFARARRGRSVLKSIKKIQDKINKLEANKMVSSEFNAWRKLIMLTSQEIPDDMLEMRPDRAMVLHPGGLDNEAATNIWEGSATELSNYDKSIQCETEKLFTIAGLPKHMLINQGRTPSGDAIEADEGPLLELIADAQRVCEASWIDLMDLFGIIAQPLWRPSYTKPDKDIVEAVKNIVGAGMPLDAALKRYAGWTDEDIQVMHAEADALPASPGDTMKNLQSLGSASALGAVRPEHAQAVAAKMLGLTPKPAPKAPANARQTAEQVTQGGGA